VFALPKASRLHTISFKYCKDVGSDILKMIA